jgi:hypothetical protein
MALTINQKIVNYVRGNLGKQIADGECWTLAERALAGAGAQTSKDIMGPSNVTPNADYVWGDEIDHKDIIPGDVLQFRDYVMTTTTVVSVLYTNLPAGVTVRPNPVDESEQEETFDESHHTSIASSGYANKRLSVLHQNVPPKGKKVQAGTIALESIPATKAVSDGTRMLDVNGKKIRVNVKVSTTVTVTVEGSIWAYRPRKK